MGINLNKIARSKELRRKTAIALGRERNHHHKAALTNMERAERIDRTLKKFGARVKGDMLTFKGERIDLKD